MFRYSMLLFLLLATFFSGRGQGKALTLWYRQPAHSWTEALPIGNGDQGAMIYGGVKEEVLQLNESTWWTGAPHSYQREDASQYLDTIRQLLFAGNQAAAEAIGQEHFLGKKYPDEGSYDQMKAAWYQKVRSDTSAALEPANDSWFSMTLPTPDGWEATGLKGLDGALWFQDDFDLPAGWSGKDLYIDLGRIRDVDFTYINGHRIGTAEGISTKRHYLIPAGFLRPGRNHLAVQVINWSDKGGFTGLKGTQPPFVVYPVGGDVSQALHLDTVWRYKVQDQELPMLPKFQADYQPFGYLHLQFGGGGGEATDYVRALDLHNAISSVSYMIDGVRYRRDYLASVPQKAIVAHLIADKPGHISFLALLNDPAFQQALFLVDAHTMGIALKARDGKLKGVAYLHVDAQGGTVAVESGSFRTGGKTAGGGAPVGMGIRVTGASEATVILTMATSFVNYHDITAEPGAICSARMRALQGLSWTTLRENHLHEYQPYFNTFSIHFGTGISAGDAMPTDERINQYTAAKDAGLIVLYMQYGRYLMLASSRPGANQPANLQGIWNDELTPPWGSKFTTNINLEMNYWIAEPLNLSACSMPLFNKIRELAETGTGQATAEAYYKAPGWVLHHNTDLWDGTAPINASNHGIWPTGGAWLCHQIWEHYLYTGDKRFLQEYYPVMRSAADFFVHFLIRDPRSGYLISTPSASPEHGGLVAGPTMDHQIIRDLFKNCIAAAAVLKTDAAFSKTLAEKYTQIAPDKIGRYGQLQEWLEDKDDTADTHRHISHLWGVYPGTDITWKDTALMKAAKQSMLYRGDAGTGWSMAWKVNCWARFRDGDHALTLLNKLLSAATAAQNGEHAGVYPNMFDAHPPFQIDGNFGGPAGVAEMLLQSQDGEIELLPALPKALATGSVEGICARGGFELNMQWQQGHLQEVTILSRVGGDCRVSYGGKKMSFSTRAGERIRLSGDLKIIK